MGIYALAHSLKLFFLLEVVITAMWTSLENVSIVFS
jgi:hypothetical protein